MRNTLSEASLTEERTWGGRQVFEQEAEGRAAAVGGQAGAPLQGRPKRGLLRGPGGPSAGNGTDGCGW